MEERVTRKPGSGKKTAVIVAMMIAVTVIVGAVFIWANDFSLMVQLVGGSEITVEYGTEYSDPGASVILQGKILLTEGRALEKSHITSQGAVDCKTLGTYTVTYNAEYLGMQVSAQRQIHVVDTTPPRIELMGDPQELEEGIPYEEQGFTALDDHDGDLTDKVQRQELYGAIIYTVEDSSGNVTTVERTVPYYDPLPPTILLEGELYYTINLGTPWEDPGFIAVDNVAGELTDQTVVEGSVDSFQPGLYFIKYIATDTHENRSSVTRVVEVVIQPHQQTVMPEGKVIYLTFDDGPGPYTRNLLEVLAKYDVKATFFVIDGDYNHVMRQIVDQGHSIGIHSVTHNYNRIYASEKAYFQDLYKMQDIIYENTGVRTTLMRFPGGGSNLVSRRVSPGIMTRLTQMVQDAGFQYFDWNVSSEDAGGTEKTREVYANVIQGIQGNRVSVVLQHDIHSYSVDAVEDIILWGLENGYRFLPLEENSPAFHHPVKN